MAHAEVRVQNNAIDAIVATAQQILIESAQPVRHGGQVTATLPQLQTAPGGTFSQSGLRKSVELIPSDHQFPYYFTLAAAGQLNYHCLICDSLEKRSEGSFGPSPFDFWVAPNEFEASLRLIVT